MLWKKQLIVLVLALTLYVLFCGAASAANTTNMVTVADNSSSVNSSFDCQVMNVQVPFVENQGQVDGRVKYYAQTFYGTVYITTNGITHSIQDKEGNKTLVLNEQFLDATGRPIQLNPRGEEPSSTVVSYFTGDNRDNWKTNLSTYNLINLGEIYPGITVKLKAYGNNVEKLFYLEPGANVDNIKIGVQGADKISTDSEGKLVIESYGFLDVTLSAPEATQNNKTVESTYKITKNTYGFTLGNYNHQQPLTIDPTLTYSTYLGGTQYDDGYAIAVDNNGNTYITGTTDSTDFPHSTGAYQTTPIGGTDVFVSKLNPTGTTLLYSTYLGGNQNDSGSGIAVDANGNTYITGTTDSTNFPTTTDAYQATKADYLDVFVSKLNPTGTTLLYSTYLGGNQNEYVEAIAVDANGNTYITGYTDSDNFPTTTDAYQTDQPGTDIFVSKLNPTLTGPEQLIYSTYLGGTQYDYGSGIAVDITGNIYITGETASTNFPTTTGAYQTTKARYYDVFVSKLNPTLTGPEQLIYSTYLGGNDDDWGSGIAVDITGNIYITGDTYSTDFPTVGAYQTDQPGADVFVSKLNPTLTGPEQLIYSTYLGGTGYDSVRGIAVDANGNTYIIGTTESTNFPITPGAYQTDNAGGVDVFVSKLNPTLTGPEQLIYSTYLGGTGNDWGSGIAVDANGNTYITGYTYSTDFPTTTDAYQTDQPGTDVFVVKFSAVDLAVSKVVDFAIQSVGGDVTYTITATNHGPDDATGVTVTDLMPSGLHLVSATSPNYDMGTDTWNIGNLANGATTTLQIVARILQAGTFTNTAIITGQEIDPVTGNNQASVTVTGLSAPPKLADLAVTKTVDLASQWIGQNVTYNITATNNGPDDATGVMVIDLMPVGLSFVSATASTGTSYNTTTNTWNIGNLAKGATATLKIVAKILQSGTFTNTATITGQQTDPITSNNQATATVLGKQTTAPLVTSTIPANGATGVSLNPTITINFNQPVTLGSGWVQLKLTASPGTNIPISPLTINGNTATFKTLSTLSRETQYTIIIHSASVNATNGGLPLASPYVTRFTTATAPLVTSTIPANGATGVSLNPNITINFNQPVTLGSGWVQLKLTANPGTNIPISPLTINGNTATFKTLSPLSRETQYTIIVHSSSVNATNGGLPLASPYVTRFTTQT